MQDDLQALIVAAIGSTRDPYPRFAEQRKNAPVDVEKGWGGEPRFSLYRYADADRVLRDPETFSSRAYAPAIGRVLGPSILQLDGAEHHRHRALIGGSFRRSVLAEWETSFIEPTVHALIDGFAGGGSAELVRELTIQFPIRVISKMLGIPVDDFDHFMRQSIRLINIMGDVNGGLAASKELREIFATILVERRRAPTDDVISTLAQARIDGEPLPDEEIFGFLRLLLPAGAETTYRLLGTLLFALLSEPARLEAVRADRSLVAAAIEEALRWESPVQFIDREATRDVEVAGVTIPAGSVLSIALGSANRDEEVFEDADRFDMTVARAPHLAFAEGPHRCLGEHLARLETTVAINAVLDRLPDLRLHRGDDDPHIAGDAFRSPTCLPVRFAATRDRFGLGPEG